ncbi:zinc ribbon domain-containing protein [Couchioplanes caeruleus]|uniref:Zinc ribbon domain-containing protein n=2 Tax=Couchioplanes caeruleus TaxID=56438 RepID=A0A1K0FN98_9ACTN|nr:zinc ribbon domain-containing protein [Couchioplanes caeruleus]OJF14184.1 hypothetical protein BG844_11035 [Couchioplanes caeruleus subsp. caeruleus]ROP28309.1 hypothetical protein EDD30_1056 [Couchioplanes caeruleus]
MGMFKTERRFWTDVTDLEPIVEALTEHFCAKGYEVVSSQTGSGAWDVDITRTGVFRAVAGLRTALKVRLEAEPGSVWARAGVGVFGQQVLPAVVTMFFLWPVIVTQIWGVVRAAKADDEAIAVIEAGLERTKAIFRQATTGAGSGTAGCCAACGTPQSSGGRFCTNCGAHLASS